MNILLKASAWDPDPLDLKDFGFLDPDPQKYVDPRGKISTKNWNFFILKPRELLKKVRL